MPGDRNCTSPSGAIAQVDVGRGRPDRVRAHGPVGLGGDEQERFRLSVELLQVEPDRAIEGEEVGADRLARGISNPDACEAERVLERRVDQEIAETVGDACGERDIFAISDCLAPAPGDRHEPTVEPALERPRVLHADLHPRKQRLEHTRRGEMIGRADFPQVAGGGVGALRAGHAEARHVALRVVQVMVASPGERQIGEHLVTIGETIEGDGVARRGDRTFTAQHDAFRAAGCARGVEDDGGIHALAGVDSPVEVRRRLRVGESGATFRHDRFERMQTGLAVVAEAARLVIKQMA